MPTARKIPVYYIGKEITNELVKNFIKLKSPALKATFNPEKDDTQSIWYSFDQIEELYKELIYQDACGVRFYFGAYPEGTATDKDEDISNQLCLVMVPTTLNPVSKKQKDIILEETTNFAERPGSERYLNGSQNDGTMKGFDQGAPCPPSCDDQEFGYPME